MYDEPARRDVYALLPDTGARRTDEELIAALSRALPPPSSRRTVQSADPA